MEGTVDGSIYEAIVGYFGPVMALIVLIALAVIAVLRFGIRFDLNKYLEARKRKHRQLARANCVHMSMEPCDGGVEILPLWESPAGTLDWVCSRCGTVVHTPPDDEQFMKRAQYYASHPDEYRKKMKQFNKHARKSY